MKNRYQDNQTSFIHPLLNPQASSIVLILSQCIQTLKVHTYTIWYTQTYTSELCDNYNNKEINVYVHRRKYIICVWTIQARLQSY